MARFTVSSEVGAPATKVWDALVDWPRHGDWVPLTRVWVTTDRAGGVGAEFVGRTGVGPVAFDDPMRVVRWEPPEGDKRGLCEVVKLGRLLHGRAWFSVTPLPGGRCRVVWDEDVTVTPVRVTRFGAPLLSLVGKAGFVMMLRTMAREVEGG
jgi:hypothetical protein